MRKILVALTAASALSLSACASNPRVAENAAYGAAGGAAIGAVVPGVSVIEGAAVGAAIGGLSGAIWSDSNNDGYVDGYVSNGQYYAGQPQGYDPTTRSVGWRRSWRRGSWCGRRCAHPGPQRPSGRGDRRCRRRRRRRCLG